MINVFLRWLSEQRRTNLAFKGRQCHGRGGFASESEVLERRVLLTVLHNYQIGGAHAQLSQTHTSPGQTITLYEDLTGDGFTPDDVLLPTTIHVQTEHSVLEQGEIEIAPNQYQEHDTYTSTVTDKTIPNGGTLESTYTIQWDDLIPNGVFDAPGPDNDPDYFNGWSADHIVRWEDTTDGADLASLFPADQKWIQTSSYSDETQLRITYVREYTVKGRAYEDLNGNGAFDTGEPPSPGYVYLDRNLNDIFDETVNGFNSYHNDLDGTFTATFRGRGAIGFGIPNDNKYLMLTEGRQKYFAPHYGDPDGSLNDIVFGVFQTAPVQGFIFDDVDGDGEWHPAQGEGVVAGIPVIVTQNGKTYHGVSSSTGLFTVYLGPGTYQVTQDLSQVGVRQTAPPPPGFFTGTITTSHQDMPVYYFGRTPGKDVSITAATRIDAKGVDFTWQSSSITGSFAVSVYRSADPVWDESDISLAQGPQITPGTGVQTGSGHITFLSDYIHDSNRPYLVVVADPQKKIGEVNETNNALVVQRIIDLTPLQVMGDFTYDAPNDKFVSDGTAQVGFKPVIPEAFVPLISGNVTYSQDQIRLSGLLSSSYGSVPVPLIEGSLILNVPSGATSTFNVNVGLYQLVGAKFDFQKVELVNPSGGSALDSYLSIEGLLTAPPGFGGFQVQLANPNYIHLGPVAPGIAATIPLGADKKVSLGGMFTLEANGAAISYLSSTESNPDGAFRLQGKFTFKNEQLKSADDPAPALDISAPNYAEFGKNGEFYIGKFTINNLTILPNALSLKMGSLFLDTVHHEWKVDGELILRPMTDANLLFGAGMYEDDFNYIRLGLSNLNIPTFMAGVVLNKISLSADNLAGKKRDAGKSVLPIEVSASVGLSEGPAFSILPIPFLDISAHETHIATLDVTGTASRDHLGGNVQFVYMDPKLLTLTGSFDWNWKKSEAKLTGGLSAWNGSLVGGASVTVNQRGMIGSGSLTGTLKLPDVAGYKMPVIASAVLRGYFQYLNGGNSYLALSTDVTLPVIGKKTLAVRIPDYGEVEYFLDTMVSLENVPVQSPTANLRSVAPQGLQAPPPGSSNTFTVTSEAQQLLLSATWANPLDDVMLEIVRPDGSILTESDLDGENSALIPLMTSSTSRAIALLNPMEGDWQIHVVSAGDPGDIQYAAFRDGTDPTVQVLDAQVARDEVTIHYTATAMDPDSTVTLFYDSDNQGFDGMAITDSLPVTGDTVSATWDLSHSFSGTYYLYAALTDSQGGVYFQYLDTPVTVDADPPTTRVTALSDVTNTSSFTLSWSGSDDANGSGIASYDIYVSDNGGDYTLFLDDTTLTTAQFNGELGHTYAFYSVATDMTGHVEAAHPEADAQTATVAPNQSPDILDAVFALAENSGSNSLVGTVTATDPDEADTLTYSITGGNSSGAFAINPDTGEIRVADPEVLDFETTSTFTLTVEVADNHGAIDSASVTVNLADIDETLHLNRGGSEVTWIKKQPAVVVLPLVTVAGANLGGGTLTLSLNAPGKKKPFDTLSLLSSTGLGTTSGLQFGNGHLTLQIQLGQAATAASIQAFLRGIKFSTKGAGLKSLTRTLTVTLVNASGQSSLISQTVNVNKRP